MVRPLVSDVLPDGDAGRLIRPTVRVAAFLNVGPISVSAIGQ
ncbi:hypothetical protein HMPREF3220_04496 [Citrobacter koseri]|nr:hypothetical protein HMPREF3220_04496 [Citrobacter koseri]KXA01741.1 hypothetical protein HMPREF3207_02677 [Citrobacter koseri]